MPTYVAFLRAINLGRHRKVPMAELRGWLTEAGYGEVATHIHTGNVRVVTGRRSAATVERDLEQLLRSRTGFEVPTVAFTAPELRRLLTDALSVLEQRRVTAERRYLALLKEPPPADLATRIDGWSAPGEGAHVVGRAVLWWLDHSVADAKLSNARFEGGGAISTTRDLKVVTRLVEKWC